MNDKLLSFLVFTFTFLSFVLCGFLVVSIFLVNVYLALHLEFSIIAFILVVAATISLIAFGGYYARRTTKKFKKELEELN